MRRDTDRTGTPRRRTPPGGLQLVVATAAVLVVALTGCTSTEKVDVGPAGPGGTGTLPPSTAMPVPPATRVVLCLLQNGGTVPCDPTNLPLSDPPIVGVNCESAPASTAVGMPGGGEIVCDPLPGQTEPGSPGEPPETTVPGSGDDSTVSTIVQDPAEPITTTTVRPDATHGVLRGTASGGLDCAADQPCPAIGIIVAGTVVAEDGAGNRVTGEIDAMGSWGIRLPPGTYRITVQAEGSDHCDPTTAAVTAGAATEVNLTCGRPM